MYCIICKKCTVVLLTVYGEKLKEERFVESYIGYNVYFLSSNGQDLGEHFKYFFIVK